MPIDNVKTTKVATVRNNESQNQKANNSQPSQNEQHDYKKYLKFAGIAAAAVAIGCGIVHIVRSGKVSGNNNAINPIADKLAEATGVESAADKLSEITDVIDFHKGRGIAYKKGTQEAYTGIVKKTLNGDKVILEYEDGLIQSSFKDGENGFSKIYYRYGSNKRIERVVVHKADGEEIETRIVKYSNPSWHKASMWRFVNGVRATEARFYYDHVELEKFDEFGKIINPDNTYIPKLDKHGRKIGASPADRKKYINYTKRMNKRHISS